MFVLLVFCLVGVAETSICLSSIHSLLLSLFFFSLSPSLSFSFLVTLTACGNSQAATVTTPDP